MSQKDTKIDPEELADAIEDMLDELGLKKSDSIADLLEELREVGEDDEGE